MLATRDILISHHSLTPGSDPVSSAAYDLAPLCSRPGAALSLSFRMLRPLASHSLRMLPLVPRVSVPSRVIHSVLRCLSPDIAMGVLEEKGPTRR